MMKNTEWGAVAYLQHSQFGSQMSVRINNNSVYVTGYGAVNEPMTGYSVYSDYGTTNDITQPWNTDSGRLASTTNNMYGVYDMSGGTWEVVMGVMLDSANVVTAKPCSGRNAAYNSGFNGKYCNIGETGSLTTGVDFPKDKRYYDIYTYGTTSEGFQRRILGDATGEMGPFQIRTYGIQQRPIGSWYDDEAWFVRSDNPWFFRGRGFYVGSGAGVFMFANVSGTTDDGVGFRVVLML